MAKLTKKKTVKTKKLTTEEQAQQFWTEVDEKAKWEIYEVLTHNLPLQNVKPIIESWRYQDQQTKLVGLFFEKDVDYRTISSEFESQYEEELPSSDYLAEAIAYHYLLAIIKGIIGSLSAYDCHDPAYLENLTNYENY